MGARKQGEKPKGDHHTILRRSVMETEAWRAISPKAQSLYIWLKLEWKGPKFNNNGRIQLSCRQASCKIGIGRNAAMAAFHELQAKGFILVTERGSLGVEGEARGPKYELTELLLPHKPPKALFLKWKASEDFEVIRHKSGPNNSAA